jgi:hypothetical protein
MIEFTRTRTSTAPIDSVFDVMTDHRGFADCSWMFRRSTIEHEGTPAPNGLGAIRRLASYGTTFVEEIIEYERPTRWAYKMLAGVPTRDQVGTIKLRQTGTGTEVSWHLTAKLKVTGLDWLAQPIGKWFIDQLLRGALSAAERRGEV